MPQDAIDRYEERLQRAQQQARREIVRLIGSTVEATAEAMMGERNSGYGTCAICRKHDYLHPLHGEKGGPGCCLLCVGAWQAEHGRRRRLGRIVIRAMLAYQEGGGKWSDLDKLKFSAMGLDFGIDLDPLGYLADTAKTTGEIIELTSELLADAIRLTHPDRHPPERADLAKRVTAGLVALQPFVFPAPKPVAPPAPASTRTGSIDVAAVSPQTAVTSFPCPDCADTVPLNYCNACRAEWGRRQAKEREREAAKRREWYARRKARLARHRRPTICATCGTGFKGKRRDARFCSDACRQRAHRKPVTDKKDSGGELCFSRDTSDVATHEMSPSSV